MIAKLAKQFGIVVSAIALGVVVTLGGGATPAVAGTNGMPGGFTQTYGWGVPADKVTVRHNGLVLPEMRGIGVFRYPDLDFVRAGVIFNGPIPSYQFKYVSAEEAAGCSGTQLPGERFFTISLYSTTFSEEGGVPPVGEIIPIDDGGIINMALVCTDGLKGTYSFGLTGPVEIRTGDLNDFDPYGGEYSMVAMDFKDPL